MHILQTTSFLRHKRYLRALLLDNQPWFVVRDLGRLINHPLERQLSRSLDDDQLRREGIQNAQGRYEEVLLVSESGVYVSLINYFHPENCGIRRWISGEVVPTLRDAHASSAAEPRRRMVNWDNHRFSVLQWQGQTWVPFAELPRLLERGSVAG